MRLSRVVVVCLLLFCATPAYPQFSNQYRRYRTYTSYKRQQPQAPRVQLHEAFASGKETPWSVLGIDKSASEKDVKTAYRRLALENHPDKGGSEEKFILAKAAFDTLTQEDLIEEYRSQTAQSEWKRSNRAPDPPRTDGWSIIERWSPWVIGAATVLGVMAFWGDQSSSVDSETGEADSASPEGTDTGLPTQSSWMVSVRKAAREQAASAVELGELKLPADGSPAKAVKRAIVVFLPRKLAESGAAWTTLQSCAKMLQSDGIRLAWALTTEAAAIPAPVATICPDLGNELTVSLLGMRYKSSGLFAASTSLNSEAFDGKWLPGAEAKAWCERVSEGLLEMTKAA